MKEKTNIKWNLLTATFAAAAIFILSACAGTGEKKTDTETAEEKTGDELVELTERQLKTVGIALGPLEQRSLGAAVQANGELRLNPQDRASIVPLTAGVVHRILVKEGDAVRAGQTVAYIENTQVVALQQDCATAERELAAARQELQRQQLLKRENAGVERNYKQAEAAVSVAQSRVTGLRQQLSQLGVGAGGQQAQRTVAVSSPIGGTVSRVNASTGSYADAQSPIMEVVNNNAVFAQLKVFEKDLSRITTGQTVDIALTYQQDTHISGRVESISRSIDAATRSASVHVRLDVAQLSGRRLGEGMSVTAMISSAGTLAEAVPNDAIVSMDGRKFVFVLDHTAMTDGQKSYFFRRVEVVTGESELGHTAVSFPTPPKADAQFVRAGAFYIASAASDHGEE